MAFRDPQPIALSRQAVLLVTAVGVGLIATSYILGVQVGKGSASLRKPDAKSVDEQLKELPEPLLDQLKLFQPAEKPEDSKPVPVADPAQPRSAAPPAPEAKTVPKAEAADAKAEPKAASKPDAGPEPASGPAEKWTLQLVATPEKAEADRVAARARAAGFPARTVKDGKAWKVRLAKAAPKEAADATAERMRSAGFKPFAVRAD